MKEDFKKFTLLQKVLVIIDLILNPRATNYPFLYTPDFHSIKKSLPKRHIVIKQFEKDGKHWVWCIRWL